MSMYEEHPNPDYVPECTDSWSYWEDCCVCPGCEINREADRREVEYERA